MDGMLDIHILLRNYINTNYYACIYKCTFTTKNLLFRHGWTVTRPPLLGTVLLRTISIQRLAKLELNLGTTHRLHNYQYLTRRTIPKLWWRLTVRVIINIRHGLPSRKLADGQPCPILTLSPREVPQSLSSLPSVFGTSIANKHPSPHLTLASRRDNPACRRAVPILFLSAAAPIYGASLSLSL